MISLWITVGLVIAAVSVSTLGAYFSIVGIGALFSGAMLAVWLMAGALEFAKFVLAAYLHQTWRELNRVYRYYLTFAVVVLSLITSIGVFGFLSEAYQSASTVLEAENIKLANIQKEKKMHMAEIARLNRSVEEIPATRITRRLRARAEVEPLIRELNLKIQQGEKSSAAAELAVLDVKKKVGPLIYIARSLNTDIDSVVKYLILIFVSVFDPLAICLVIASTHAIESRRRPGNFVTSEKEDHKEKKKNEQWKTDSSKAKLKVAEPEGEDSVPSSIVEALASESTATTETERIDEDVIVQMNFKDADENKNQKVV